MFTAGLVNRHGARRYQFGGILRRQGGGPAMTDAGTPRGPGYDPGTGIALSADTTPSFYGFGPPYAPSGAYSGTPMQLNAADAAGQMPTGAQGPFNVPTAGGVFVNSEGRPEFEGVSGTFPANWRNYMGNTSTGGGFFTMDQIAATPMGPPQSTPGPDGGQTTQPTFGSVMPEYLTFRGNLPSTNNWRLLPGAYRSPDFVLRNGMIIDRAQVARGNFGSRGAAVSGEEQRRPVGRGIAPWVEGGFFPGSTRVFFWPGGDILTQDNIGMSHFEKDGGVVGRQRGGLVSKP